MDEKIRFLEEKKFAKTLEENINSKENSGESKNIKNSNALNQNITNPITGAFLRFVHFKHKFNIKDL